MIEEFNVSENKEKKNVFTLTTLILCVVIIILLTILLTVFLDRKYINRNENNSSENNATNVVYNKGSIKEEKFNNNLQTVKDAAINYFTIERLPKTVGSKVKLTLKEMQDKKLILDVIDSTGNVCSVEDSYVEVTKEATEYAMKIYLSCNDMQDYIIVYLGCYDYCKDTICEKQVTQYFEYEYKKQSSCKMGDWSSWGPWQTNRESTSDYKKEDIKVVVAEQEVVDTKNPTVTYNCDKYPGYKLNGNTCTKTITGTETKPATVSYTCPNGYILSGTKCVKATSETKPATVSYTCQSGYTLSGTKCNKTTTTSVDATKKYTCPSGYTLSGTTCTKTTTTSVDATKKYTCPSGYTLSGTTCTKTTTSTVGATPRYSTRSVPYSCSGTVAYTCYRQACTTKTVFSCQNGTCGNYPVTSCENVADTCYRQEARTCYRNEQYVSGYSCPSGYILSGTTCTRATTDTKAATVSYSCASGYTLSGTKCNKTTTDTKTATVSYSCASGYTLSGTKCNKTTTDTKTATVSYSCASGYTLSGTKCNKTTTTSIDATKKYSCASGYTLSGTNCVKTTKETIDATKKYSCASGYTLSGTTCTKTTTTLDQKPATASYACASGYTLSQNKCIKKSTENVQITYYRYSTRSCDGGTTDTQWSTSQNDQTLLNKGYQLTGNKRPFTSK